MNRQATRQNYLYLGAALLACILWSLAFVFIKIGLEYMPPLQFAGIRFLLSGLILSPLAYHQSRKENYTPYALVRSLPRHFTLGVLQIGLKYGCFYIGVALLPAALSALISGTNPLVVALLAHWVTRDDKLTPRKLFALLLGVVGVLVLTFTRREMGAIGEWALLGIFLLLLTNILSGMGDLWVRRESQHTPSALIASLSLLFGGLFLLLVGWSYEGIAHIPTSFVFYGALLLLCIISSGAFALWFWILQRSGVKVSNLNMWKFLIPLLGALSAWFILPNEHASLGALLGMSFIVSSLVVLFWKRNVKKERIR